jgi:hypothetical protein
MSLVLTGGKREKKITIPDKDIGIEKMMILRRFKSKI